jgi:hypothetical protein
MEETKVTTPRKRLAFLALFIASAGSVAMLGGRAAAATRPTLAKAAGPAVRAVPERAVTSDSLSPSAYYLLENAGWSQCVQQDGTTSAVYGGTCASSPLNNETVNHSLVWEVSAAANFSLDNEHSGDCITADRSDTNLYMQAPPCTNHSQEWNEFDWVTMNLAGTSLGLQQVAPSSIDASSQAESIWYVTSIPAS